MFIIIATAILTDGIIFALEYAWNDGSPIYLSICT